MLTNHSENSVTKATEFFQSQLARRPLFKTTNTLALNQVTPSKAKNRTKIFTKTYLATPANHRSDYTARFYAKKKTELFTPSTDAETAKISRIARTAKIARISANAGVIY